MQDNNNNSNSNEASATRSLFWGCLYASFNEDGMPVYRFVWVKIIKIFLSVFISLWIVESISVFCFFRFARDYDDMSVGLAITFPFSRSSINKNLGDMQIRQSKSAMNDGLYQKAYLLLKTGLARSPANLDGRLSLADFLRAIHQDDQAISILEGGLPYHADNPLFLKAYLQTLVSCNEDGKVVDYAKIRLAKCGDNPTDPERMVAYVAAQVAELNGQYSITLDYLDKYKLDGTVEGCMLKAKCHWDAEDRNGAINLLRSFMLTHPMASPVEMGCMLCNFLNEAGRNNEALTTALGLCNSNPKSDEARRMLITCYEKLGQKDRAEAEKARYIDDFENNPDALLKIADYAIGSADLALANDIYFRAGEKGYQFGIFGMLMIEAHLSAGDFTNALKYCDQIFDENPTWIKRYENQFYFLKAAASRSLGKNQVADLYLEKLHNATSIQEYELLAMAKRLKALNLDNDALSLYEQAKVMAPRNSEVIAGIVEIDLRNEFDTNFIENVDTLTNLRHDSYDLFRKARERLTSDHFVFDTRRAAVIANIDKVLEEPKQVSRK